MFFSWAVAIALAVGGADGAGHVGTSGYDSCKCIDPRIDLFHNNTALSSCTGEDSLPANVGGTTYCYPANYGARTCQRWDQNLPPECAYGDGTPRIGAPAFCSRSWCFVSYADCNMVRSKSEYFPSVSNLAFSYGACGNPDYFGSWNVMNQLQGSTIRVHVMDEPPYSYPERSSSDPRGKGAMWDVYAEIADKAGFIMEETELSPYNGTAWTACVNDVSIGAVDLCIGTFWETPSRLQVASFVTAFDVDSFRLVTQKLGTQAEFDLWSPFKPFTWWLWLAVAGIVCLVSVVIYALERRNAGDDHDDFNNGNVAADMFQSLYQSCFGLWSGQPTHGVQSPGSKMVLLSFAIFIMLLLSGYTANLASFLVVQAEAIGKVKDLQGMIDNGMKVCVVEAIMPMLLDRQPRATDILVLVSDVGEGYTAIDQGKCDAILYGESGHQDYMIQHTVCDKIFAGDVVMNTPLTQPVSSEFEATLSYWMADRRDKSRLQGLMQRYRGAPRCKTTEETHKTNQMGVDDFAATFILVGVMIALGISVRVARILGHAGHRTLSGHLAAHSNKVHELATDNVMGGRQLPDQGPK